MNIRFEMTTLKQMENSKRSVQFYNCDTQHVSMNVCYAMHVSIKHTCKMSRVRIFTAAAAVDLVHYARLRQPKSGNFTFVCMHMCVCVCLEHTKMTHTLFIQV